MQTVVAVRLIEELIAGSRPAQGPSLSFADGKVAIGAGSAPSGNADIWLVRYRKGVVEVPVGRGENSGRTLPHANVVHALAKLQFYLPQFRSHALADRDAPYSKPALTILPADVREA